MLHNADYMKIVVEKPQSLAELYSFRFRVDVVNENVIGTLQVVTFVEDESPGDGAEAIYLNPINNFEAGGIEL